MCTMDASQATLKDLCPRDKQKVSNLIKQVGERSVRVRRACGAHRFVAQVVELKHERAELQQTVREVRASVVQLQLHGVA
jgi:hypothetical protein